MSWAVLMLHLLKDHNQTRRFAQKRFFNLQIQFFQILPPDLADPVLIKFPFHLFARFAQLALLCILGNDAEMPRLHVRAAGGGRRDVQGGPDIVHIDRRAVKVPDRAAFLRLR